MKLITDHGKVNCIVKRDGTYIKVQVSENAAYKQIARGDCKKSDLFPEYSLCVNDTYYFSAIFDDDDMFPAVETAKTTTSKPAAKKVGRPKKSTTTEKK